MEMNYDWLDKIIEEQKEQAEIIKAVCWPFDAAELQEQAEREGWDG